MNSNPDENGSGNRTARGKVPPLPLIKSFLETAMMAASINPSRLPSGVMLNSLKLM